MTKYKIICYSTTSFIKFVACCVVFSLFIMQISIMQIPQMPVFFQVLASGDSAWLD